MSRKQAGRVPTLAANGKRRAPAEPTGRSAPEFKLKLYVTGLTPASQKAIERVRTACESHMQGRYALEVIDIYQKPALAKDEQIIATPTLIRVLPPPLRRYIGSLANVDKVLFGIDLRTVSPGAL
jgi:circadian clock protein KaiB